MMKEMKLSCSKCHFEFFATVANDKAGHLPVRLISVPFLSHPPCQLDLTNGTIVGSIRHLHISVIHLVCPSNILYTHCLQFLLE